MGDPIEDLAWAEWIVRMHHAECDQRPRRTVRRIWRASGLVIAACSNEEQCAQLRQRCEAEGLLDAGGDVAGAPDRDPRLD